MQYSVIISQLRLYLRTEANSVASLSGDWDPAGWKILRAVCPCEIAAKYRGTPPLNYTHHIALEMGYRQSYRCEHNKRLRGKAIFFCLDSGLRARINRTLCHITYQCEDEVIATCSENIIVTSNCNHGVSCNDISAIYADMAINVWKKYKLIHYYILTSIFISVHSEVILFITGTAHK